MTQQLLADRRVRSATYELRPEVVIRSVVSEKPFVYAVASHSPRCRFGPRLDQIAIVEMPNPTRFDQSGGVVAERLSRK